MFNRADRNRALEAERRLLAAEDTIVRLNNRAVLADIERAGRVIKFHFVRAGKLTVIETYGTLGDDTQGWKEALL